ncbi:MAG: matrixin family metalloprotease [Planctomycetaceae bacterium]
MKFFKRPHGRRRGTVRQHEVHAEQLEQRTLLTAIAWADAPNLGISFAPDGTDIAGYENDLQEALDSIAPRSEWQATIQQAFDAWTTHIDADTHLVPDNGDRFGISGAAFGDPRFGEIRIGSIPSTPDFHAFAIPHDEFVSGTWSGDIVFNSNADLNNLDDLYAITLHEAGHVLGLDHNDDPDSAMNPHGENSEPTEDDIAALQELYGTPKQHPAESRVQFENPENDRLNAAFEDAVVLNPTRGFQHGRYSVQGRIENEADVDTYRFEGHRSWGTKATDITIVVRSLDRGGLIPKATLHRANGSVVRNAEIIQNGNGTLVIRGHEVNPRSDYYLRIESAVQGPVGRIGDYSLSISSSDTTDRQTTLIKDSLTHTNTESQHRLFVGHSQLLSLAIQSERSDTEPAADIGIAIHDADGQLIANTTTSTGSFRSLPSLLLKGGTYYVTVRAEHEGELPRTKFQVLAARSDQQSGPLLGDPTASLAFPCEDGSSNFCYDDGTVSPNPTHTSGDLGHKPPDLQVFLVTDSSNWWDGDDDEFGP